MDQQEACDRVIEWALRSKHGNKGGMHKTRFRQFKARIETWTGKTASPHGEPKPDPIHP
jgi:hypothetical protein